MATSDRKAAVADAARLFRLSPDHMFQLDVVRGSIYDSVKYTPEQIVPENEQFFARPYGLKYGRSILDTNMQVPMQFIGPEGMVIEEIIWTFSRSANERDVQLYLESRISELWLLQKCYVRESIAALPCTSGRNNAVLWRCEYCTTVFANQSNCPSCGAPSSNLFAQQDTEPGKTFTLDLRGAEIAVIQQMQFYMTTIGESFTLLPEHEGGKGLKVWIHLRGLIARGVA